MPVTAPHNPQEKVQSFQLDFKALCDMVPQRSSLPFLSLHALPSSQLDSWPLDVHVCTYTRARVTSLPLLMQFLLQIMPPLKTSC